MTCGSLRTTSGVPSLSIATGFEAVDAVADAHDHGHVVLDDEQAGVELVADAQDQRAERFALALGDAGGRLVEAQHAGARGHQAGELDHPAGTGRQLVDEAVDEGAEPEEGDDLVGFGARASVARVGRRAPTSPTVSRTVRSWNSSAPWNDRPRPSRARLAGERRRRRGRGSRPRPGCARSRRWRSSASTCRHRWRR